MQDEHNAQQEATPPVRVRPWLDIYPVTTAIIALNVAVFLAVEVTGGTTDRNLLRWGAEYGPFTLSGQWWRMLAATFLHAGYAHIGVNMFSLWSIGPLVEKLSGRWAYLLLYLSCGLGGSLASLWWHPMGSSVGASGAIFGIAGALLALLFLKHLPIQREWVTRNLVILSLFVFFNLVYGAKKGGIDNAAHVGGLITGLLIGATLVTVFEPRNSALRRYAAFPVFAVVLIGGTALVHRGAVAMMEYRIAAGLMQHGNYTDAIPHLQEAVRRDPKDANYAFQLGYAYLRIDQPEQAVGPMQQALQLGLTGPNTEIAQFDLGVAYLQLRRPADAVPYFQNSLAKSPSDANGWYLLGLAYAQAGQEQQARAALQRSLELDPAGQKAADTQRLLDSLKK